MKTMTVKEITTKEEFGRKVYWRNGYAWIARWYDSKYWNPFDWYLVKIKKLDK